MEKARHWLKETSAGLLACLVIALVAQLIGQKVPQIGSALFAIFLGIILGNTVLTQPRLTKGVRFSESKLLEFSIALTGLTLNLQEVVAVGAKGGLYITLQMTGTILVAYFLGKVFGFTRRFTLLMCAGNAVCGSSAIGTVAPIIEADEKDKGISITIVNLTGTVLMILLPLLAGHLYQHAVVPTSALIGGTLQSIGQVIASAKLVSEPVTQYATIFKILRIILLVAVAFVFARLNPVDQEPIWQKKPGQSMKKKVGIPWFIVAFFVGSLVLTFVPIPPIIRVLAKQISGQFEIIALAGIGMRVKFKDLVKEGPKAMAFGGAIGVGQILLATSLIRLVWK